MSLDRPPERIEPPPEGVAPSLGRVERPPTDEFTQALARLVTAGTLTPEQARAVVREITSASAARPWFGRPVVHRAAARPSWTSLIAELGGYIGGAFVLAAAVVLTGPQWDGFGRAERLAVLGVPALIFLGSAAAVLATTAGGWPVHHRRGTGPRRRLASALVLVGAGLAGGVSAVAVEADTNWDGALYTGGALVVLAAGYIACRTAPLHLATVVAAAATTGQAIGEQVDSAGWEGWWVGLGLLGVALGWLVLTVIGAFDEAALGLTVSGVAAFVGGEIVATQDQHAWVGYAVLAVLAVAGLAGYVRSRHVGVLAVGVVALATVVPQAVIDYTDGALGAAGALLVVGLSILGASILGLRLRSSSPEHT